MINTLESAKQIKKTLLELKERLPVKEEKIVFFLYTLIDSQIKVDEDEYPNFIYFFDKDYNFLSAYNLEKQEFWISHKNVLKHLMNNFKLSYQEVQQQAKSWVEEHFKLKPITIRIEDSPETIRTEYAFKLKSMSIIDVSTAKTALTVEQPEVKKEEKSSYPKCKYFKYDRETRIVETTESDRNFYHIEQLRPKRWFMREKWIPVSDWFSWTWDDDRWSIWEFKSLEKAKQFISDQFQQSETKIVKHIRIDLNDYAQNTHII